MNHYRVSAEARSDLDEIWLHIANDNPDAADKYTLAIVSRFSTLASMPHMGHARPKLSPGLRSFVVGHHVIFYRLFDGGVEVARVLDGVRDLPPLFELTMNTTMEADPTKACNQDDPSSVAGLRRVDATGFIRLNALRLIVAANVHGKKK